MRFGKISATFLAIAGLTILCMTVFQPGGWGNPLAALGGLLIVLSYTVALLYGIIGIARDRPKTLAIITTVITVVAGGFVLFCMLMIGAWPCRL